MYHNFNIANTDTDSIMVYKPDFTHLSRDERLILLHQLNEISPKMILWEDDGYFSTVIILRAKNYILYDGKKKTVKGSALKDSKKEIALKEMQQEIIQAILEDKNNFVEIYNKYVKEAMNIKDIKRWSSKKTITSKLDTSERSNETKVKAAIAGTNYKEGDKIWTHFRSDGSVCLLENFNGDYDKGKMLHKVFASMQIFENIMDMSQFPDYKLKRNKKALDELLNEW